MMKDRKSWTHFQVTRFNTLGDSFQYNAILRNILVYGLQQASCHKTIDNAYTANLLYLSFGRGTIFNA